MSAGVTTAEPARVRLDAGSSEVARAEREREDREEREETLSVATTSLAAVATAWAAFQAATWGGRQTFAIAEATKLRQQSAEARLEGDQQQHLDASLFVAYAGAYAQGNADFGSFLYERFPPRLKVATDAWLATKPRESKDAPPHPLVMAAYKVDAHEEARTLGQRADAALDEGKADNRISDTYVQVTVVFATIMLLSSLAVRLRARRPRLAMLGMSGVALMAALAWLALRPIAWAGVD